MATGDPEGDDDEDGIPTSVEYENEESVRLRYEAAMARLTAAAGPPGGLAAAALRWAAEAGLHPGAFLRVPDRPRRPLVHTPVAEGLGQFHREAGPAATRSESACNYREPSATLPGPAMNGCGPLFNSSSVSGAPVKTA